MKLLLLLSFLLLGGCAASKDDIARIPMLAQAPVERTSTTKCGLYAEASTQSEMLTMIDSGTRVQVLDESNAHFVRARLTLKGKDMVGYMYRACLAGR